MDIVPPNVLNKRWHGEILWMSRVYILENCVSNCLCNGNSFLKVEETMFYTQISPISVDVRTHVLQSIINVPQYAIANFLQYILHPFQDCRKFLAEQSVDCVQKSYIICRIAVSISLVEGLVSLLEVLVVPCVLLLENCQRMLL